MSSSSSATIFFNRVFSFLETAHLRQLRPTHPAEPLAPVVIRRVADTHAATGRLHVAAIRQLHLNLPQQLQYVLVRMTVSEPSIPLQSLKIVAQF